ncbi:ABC transporter [Auritidibacter sp. NML120779]|nr:ABC transporter [Auritidibacter sp. NML120779]
MTPTTPPALEVRDLSVHYGEVTALSGVNLVLPTRGVTGLVGMNGSGKSTLFKTIMGLIRPSSGRVLIAGEAPHTARKRGTVAYVPQSEDVDWAFPISVREVVMMGRYGKMGSTRRPTSDDHAAVEAALQRVQLTELAERQIGQLSGGQKKRAFVARGIAQGASIMLLDEPFAGVDQRSEATMVGLLRQLAADGRTVLVSSHDLHALPELADQAVLLMRRVLFHGSVDQALAPEKLALAFGLQEMDR